MKEEILRVQMDTDLKERQKNCTASLALRLRKPLEYLQGRAYRKWQCHFGYVWLSLRQIKGYDKKKNIYFRLKSGVKYVIVILYIRFFCWQKQSIFL